MVGSMYWQFRLVLVVCAKHSTHLYHLFGVVVPTRWENLETRRSEGI